MAAIDDVTIVTYSYPLGLGIAVDSQCDFDIVFKISDVVFQDCTTSISVDVCCPNNTTAIDNPL